MGHLDNVPRLARSAPGGLGGYLAKMDETRRLWLVRLARYLEANGIPTVIMGCAKDIAEYCGVPRFVFSDFPLGNSAGKPHDVESQALTLELALRLLESAPGARTTMQSPLRWSTDASWKLDYNNIAQMSAEELARRRAEFDRQKEIARGNRAA